MYVICIAEEKKSNLSTAIIYNTFTDINCVQYDSYCVQSILQLYRPCEIFLVHLLSITIKFLG